MRPLLPAAALLALLSGPLAAQEAVPCEDRWLASVANLSFPLEHTVRSFAEGAVHVLILAAEDPACCGVFAAVLLPEPADGYRTCRLLLADPASGGGWGGLAFAGEARYDPQRGLAVPLDASVWTGEDYSREALLLTVNQATGRVAVEPR